MKKREEKMSAAPTSGAGTLVKRLEHRRAEIDLWLSEVAPEAKSEQRHTLEGTPERAYWHYGYMMALRDVLTSLQAGHRVQ